jgi:hypothetical protein
VEWWKDGILGKKADDDLILLTRQFTTSFRPQRSGEPESSKSYGITGFPPSRE